MAYVGEMLKASILVNDLCWLVMLADENINTGSYTHTLMLANNTVARCRCWLMVDMLAYVVNVNSCTGNSCTID